MSIIKKTMDGNEAAAYASYAFTEVATIYPITPSSPMAEHVDVWASRGKKNIFGQTTKLVEMQSEAGACGAMHGSLETGALTSSYTASQGLLLMVPPLYRIAGQLLPGVVHVAARTVGTSAFSIFGDHSDVMACRQTGFAQLSSANVQECMDLGAIAHLSAIKGHVPFMHFFDGFRTSHEVQKIDVLDYDDLAELIDYEALEVFRGNALNSEHPVMRSTVANPDTYFQLRESQNVYYDAVPGIVADYMESINKLTGKSYQLFNYYGAADAERVVIAMGSVCDCLGETVAYLNAMGEKVGFIQVHLFRPFSVEHFLNVLPATCKILTVLDRTKEPGAYGDPLFTDVCSVLVNHDVRPKILAGRYGLSSKDTTPAQMKAVYDNMANAQKDHFTVGIDDDVTFRSLPVGENIITADPSTISCKFWGLGSDGTVGANKNSIKIIGDHTDQYVQAYFEYDTKKSGGVTKSHLRFGKEPIRSTYYVTQADFVACHNQSYMDKYDIVDELKENGTFLLNCSWSEADLQTHLSNRVKRILAQKNIQFYLIDGEKIAREIGLGHRANSVLQSAFFKLSGILPIDDAVDYMKAAIKKSYSAKGEAVLNMNYAAVDQGVSATTKVTIPASWSNLVDEIKPVDPSLPAYIRNILQPVNAQKGDSLPVSIFKDQADGTVPVATSRYEKRGFATQVPMWIADNCIGCNQCALVCPHSAIRPFLLDGEEVANAPESYITNEGKGKGFEGLRYRLQVDPLDCTGCGSCISSCIAKENALVFQTLESQMPEQANWDYSLTLKEKANPMSKYNVKGSQFEQPLLEFSGACAGCGETPYMKLLTQLYGDRMYVANATGCTQAWGFAVPSYPYCKNSKGRGPALSNSLFENNAEFSLGMCLGVEQQRSRLADRVHDLIGVTTDETLKTALEQWTLGFDDKENTVALSEAVMEALANTEETGAYVQYLKNHQDHLIKKSMWMYGGDGWAYDIGFGGLDHVLATGADVNILVVDTEVYSNTGGQSSKATPLGAVAQFASAGKRSSKKDLGLQAIDYGNVYVASVALGASPAQLLQVYKEAEAHNGPSLIIAYAPCINHGIVKGMAYAQQESKLAVEAGYWFLYHYNPALKLEGKNPFVLDSKEPTKPLKEFLLGEVRYASLQRSFPEEAEHLLAMAAEQSHEKWLKYQNLAK
ncbi:pyruvate:ferredoxin (flavodoxin) oxidoreductase [Chakrabartyella piscis]|uniref:pyruvate:ferredoxin (flavodoxin) oxidoreductase n=1 Tax=Chakrabartyella piscis TaxID=2918914 RepID=UPI002958CD3A|nr:pyruvate:ferredoxin (flavodoxin) oxidoreductase [Chakrabartyella piscis]